MVVLGSIFGVKLLTQLLTPVSYGELALGMTAATLVNQTIFGPLSNGVTRFYAPACEKGQLGGYLYGVRRLVVFATGIILLLLLIIVTGLMAAGLSKWLVLGIAALGFSVFTGFNAILDGIQNAARQRSVVALHQGIGTWLRFFFAAGLLLAWGKNSWVAMIGYAISAVLVIGSQSIFFFKIIFKNVLKIELIQQWQKKIWEFSWPISIFGVFTWLQLVSDRWALEVFSTTHEVGLYSVLFQLGYYPMSMATGIAMQFLTPIFYQRAGDATDRQRVANVTKMSWYTTILTMIFTIFTFLTAFFFHNQIFTFLVGINYLSVSFLLPWMLLSGGIFAAGQALSLNLQSQMKIREIMTAKIVTALIGVIFNFAGAYWYGIKGIVISGVTFSVIYFLWMLLLSKYKGMEIV